MTSLHKSLILGLATAIAGVVFSIIPFGLDIEEEAGLGLLFKARGPRPAPADIVIVGIDKASADRLGLSNEPRKWPRSLHAKIIENLSAQGAAVIAFDIFFEEPRSAEDDALLAGAMKKAGNVVLSQRLLREKINLAPTGNKQTAGGQSIDGQTGAVTIERLSPLLPRFAESSLAAAPFPLPKIPVRVGQDWTFKTGAGDTPTMPVVTFQVYALSVYDDFINLLKKASPKAVEGLPANREALMSSGNIAGIVRDIRRKFESDPSIAGRMLARLEASGDRDRDEKRYRLTRSLIALYGGEGSRYLNFYGPAGTITTLPYDRLLTAGANADVKGKAVFVGFSELFQPEQKDSFYTVFSREDGTDLCGMEIGATEFANLMADESVRPFGFHGHVALVALWGLALGICFVRLPMTLALPGCVAAGAAYLALAAYQFKADAVWYPVVTPVFLQIPLAFLGSVLWKYVDVNKERRNIRAAFGHFLPDDVVDRVARDITKIGAESRLVYGVCLYTDIEGYTSLSERLPADELSKVINRYYKTVFRPIRQHGGIVSNAVGDSILALWVSPQPDPGLINSACKAALEIDRSVRDFSYRHESGPIHLPTRIAIHSGEILLGSMGAMDHYEYRPVGDIVNTATRIDGLNKFLGTRILVSGDAAKYMNNFILKDLGKFLMPGKSVPLKVHEVIAARDEATQPEIEACELFAKGIAAYAGQSWDEAAHLFNRYITSFGDDGPAGFYLSRCGHNLTVPPGETGDGVIRMTEK